VQSPASPTGTDTSSHGIFAPPNSVVQGSCPLAFPFWIRQKENPVKSNDKTHSATGR